MKKILLFLLLAPLISFCQEPAPVEEKPLKLNKPGTTTGASSTSAETAITASGKKVVLYSNGTWKYAEQKASNAQVTPKVKTCEDLITTEVDKVEGTSTVASKSILVSHDNKAGFRIFFLQLKGLVMSIKLVNTRGCIDDNSEISFLFTDGTRKKIASNSSFNCKGDAVIYFGSVFGNEELLQLLKTKDIEVMRISTSDVFHQETFTKENASDIKTVVNCLAN